MRKFFKLLFIVTFAGLTCNIAFPQQKFQKFAKVAKDYNNKKQQRQTLSMPLLKSANKITYNFNNGAVSPEYAYQGYIIVTPDAVSFDIYNNSMLKYSDYCSITPQQYTGFLNSLLALGVKPNPEDPFFLDGAGVYGITIQKNNDTIFQGEENYDIITSKGRLADAFTPLLTPSMMDAYKNPASKIDDTINYWDID